LTSLFSAKYSSLYAINWSNYFQEKKLSSTNSPCFKAKLYLIPNEELFERYFWSRQLECERIYFLFKKTLKEEMNFKKILF
jgi:tRNA(His) 5'-end guanylyltransferase